MKSIGIDIGTTGICGISVDIKSGEILKTVNRNNDCFIATDKDYEKIQDGEKILAIVTDIIDNLFDEDTASIGFSNQMHGIIYIDKCGKALSPLYIWQDGRGNLPYKNGKTYAEYMNSFSGYGLVTDFYNRENGLVPENTAYAATIGDFCIMNICKAESPLMHITNAASFGAFNLNEYRFTVDLPYLPKVTKDFAVAGYYKNIPVTVSVGDNQASYIGSVRNDDFALINVGTGSQISVVQKNCILPEGIEARPFDGTNYLAAGCALCGGRAFKMVERFIANCAELATDELPQNLYPKIDKLLETKTETTMSADSRFCGTRINPALKGSYADIDELNFTPADLILATLKGMSKELYDMYTLIDVKGKGLVCSGNGIRKNAALQKIVEKDFNMPLYFPLYEEEAAYGAALSSMAGSGIYNSLDEARMLIKYKGE